MHSIFFLKIHYTYGQELRLSRKSLILIILLEKAELIVTGKSGELILWLNELSV